MYLYILTPDVIENNNIFVLRIIIACVNEFSGALFWTNSRRNLSVTQRCSELHPNFRSGVEIRRHCNNDGNWSPVDMIKCTMFMDSNPVLIVHFAVIVNGSNTKDSAAIINNVSFNIYDTTTNYKTIHISELPISSHTYL